MSMASVMAPSPSLASLRVLAFSAFSASRLVVSVARTVFKFSKLSLSCAISASSSSRLASWPPNSTCSFLTSWSLASRSFLALPSSSSQKPFFVASSVASFSKRSMSFWMSVLTLANGSAASCEARVASEVLRKRCASSRSSEAAASCRAWAEAPACARAKKPWLCTWVSTTPCTKDRGLLLLACFTSSLEVAAAAGRARGFWRRSCSSTRLFTAASRPDTSFSRIASAPARASSSSLRNCARWSHSLARFSHRAVRSWR
mmetsp:Transcript_37530/g.104346  ORF Transcript_37530/g.104346 Transcript_37530/m.104346 type:complete len:260 (+) Transcript_37530:635-1414(+)